MPLNTAYGSTIAVMVAENLKVIIEAEVDRAIRDLKKTEQQTKKASGGFKDAAKSLAGLTVAGVGLSKVAGAIVQLSKAGFNAARQFQVMETEFSVLTGSMETAETLMDDLREFSAMTPMSVEAIAESAKVLQSFGTDIDDVIGQIGVLGDISLGNEEKLNRLTLAFGKIQARGKASMEEINMLLEAGVPILDELSSQFGVTQTAIFDMISAGEVGFEDINTALTSLTEEGGMFNDGMATLAQTFDGRLSTAMDNFKNLGATIFEPFLEDAGMALEKVTEFVNAINQGLQIESLFEEQEEEFNRLISTFGSLGNATNRELSALRDDTLASAEAAAAYREELMAIEPDDLSARQRIQLNNLNKIVPKQERLLELLNDELASYDRNLARTAELREVAAERAAAERAAAENAARYEELWNSRNDAQQQYNATLAQINADEQAGLIAQEEAEKARAEALQTALTASRSLVTELNAIADTDPELISVNNRASVMEFIRELVTELNGAGEAAEELGDPMERSAEQAAAALQLLAENAEHYEGVVAGAKDATGELAETATASFSDITDTLQGFGAVASAISDLNRAKLSAEEQALRDRGATEEEIAAATLDTRRKIAKQEKANATFSAIVNGAVAIQKALASAPPPFNFALAGLVAAQTGIQIAAVQAQPIPTAQFGGSFEVPPGANQDGGLVRVNSGERVDVSPARQSGGGGMPDKIVVRIADRDFVAAVEGVFNKQGGRITKKGAIQTR